MAAPKAYLDNNVVCAIGNDDLKAESEAFDTLLDLSGRGEVRLVTSQLSKEEMDRCSKQEYMKVPNRIFNLLKKDPFVQDHTLLGFHNQWDRTGGSSCPLIEDDPYSTELRRIGLDRTDAHHVMLAIRNGCDYFVTCDAKSILKYRATVEAQYPAIKLVKPSELVALLK